ncbi:MAG: PA14 domain-containing protein [Chitinophagaceae bacterium]
MLKNLLLLLSLFLSAHFARSQPCTPLGDEVTYGTNNVWMGYVYDNANFTNYKGYITEGTPASPNFNNNFGGPYTNYPTNGCALFTESFSVRYKLRKTFSAGTYTFTVSGDDAVRLSINGGASWLIDLWSYNSYTPGSVTLTLNGVYNIVLEYMDGAHQNRIYFNVEQSCVASATPEAYGSGVTWNGYMYSGINYDIYKGAVTETTGASLGFTQNFGGSAVNFPTSNCPVFTDFFSVRYKLRHTFPANAYTFTVSGDDKYRFSLDGGSSWVIDRWSYNSDNTMRMYTANLSGTYDMVLEYHEKDSSNIIQFSSTNAIILALQLEWFYGRRNGEDIVLDWKLTSADNLKNLEIERSTNGLVFQPVGIISASPDSEARYTYKDLFPSTGDAYYRIKMNELQGAISYSKVIQIRGSGEQNRIFPTIVQNNVVYVNNVRPLANATVLISDMTGRSISRKSLGLISAGRTSSVFLDDLKLSAGVYIIQLLDNKEVCVTERFVIR